MEKQIMTPEVRKRMHENLDTILDSDIKGFTLSAVALLENGKTHQLTLVDGAFTEVELIEVLFSGVEDALKMADLPATRTAAKALRQLLSELIIAFRLGDALRKGTASKPAENVTWH